MFTRILTRVGEAAQLKAPYVERVLIGLYRETEITAPELARKLQMSRGSTSTAFGKFAELGLARSDGARPARWHITADGKDLVDRILEERPDYEITRTTPTPAPAPALPVLFEPKSDSPEDRIQAHLVESSHKAKQAINAGDWAEVQSIATRANELTQALRVLKEIS